MVYTNDWIIKCYYGPLRRLTMPPPIPTSNHINRNGYFVNPIDDDCLCSCVLF